MYICDMPRGSGRLGGHALGVTFVLRDNFWKMFQTTFLARLSFQFGFIDGSVFLGGKGGAVFLASESCARDTFGLTSRPHSSPKNPLLLRLMRYKHINSEKCHA